jgi:hypothetical protein
MVLKGTVKTVAFIRRDTCGRVGRLNLAQCDQVESKFPNAFIFEDVANKCCMIAQAYHVFGSLPIMPQANADVKRGSRWFSKCFSTSCKQRHLDLTKAKADSSPMNPQSLLSSYCLSF